MFAVEILPTGDLTAMSETDTTFASSWLIQILDTLPLARCKYSNHFLQGFHHTL